MVAIGEKRIEKSPDVYIGALVPVVGVEPTRYRYHWILSPARLPIPSHRLISMHLIILPYFCRFVKSFSAKIFIIL